MTNRVSRVLRVDIAISLLAIAQWVTTGSLLSCLILNLDIASSDWRILHNWNLPWKVIPWSVIAYLAYCVGVIISYHKLYVRKLVSLFVAGSLLDVVSTLGLLALVGLVIGKSSWPSSNSVAYSAVYLLALICYTGVTVVVLMGTWCVRRINKKAFACLALYSLWRIYLQAFVTAFYLATKGFTLRIGTSF